VMARRYRYAQESGGQQLHLAREINSEDVETVALCGRSPRRGHWRMTINVPLGHACKNCLRIWRRRMP